jgi:hypothetical protein
MDNPQVETLAGENVASQASLTLGHFHISASLEPTGELLVIAFDQSGDAPCPIGTIDTFRGPGASLYHAAGGNVTLRGSDGGDLRLVVQDHTGNVTQTFNLESVINN